jgi:hypothetical protein
MVFIREDLHHPRHPCSISEVTIGKQIVKVAPLPGSPTAVIVPW